jgi:hypothetical protein
LKIQKQNNQIKNERLENNKNIQNNENNENNGEAGNKVYNCK